MKMVLAPLRQFKGCIIVCSAKLWWDSTKWIIRFIDSATPCIIRASHYSFQMCFSVIEYPFWSWKVTFSIVPKLGIFYALIFNHFDNSSYKGLSTVLQKGIFMNPTRGFAIVPTREFLFVTTWVIAFFASLRCSIFWTGKLLNANKTLFEEYRNS